MICLNIDQDLETEHFDYRYRDQYSDGRAAPVLGRMAGPKHWFRS